MNVFYTMGGGLGHLNRVSVFIRQFQITPYKIITAHPLAKTFFHPNDVIQVPVNFTEDKLQLAGFLKAEISKFPACTGETASAFYIDTFPAGLLGELVDFKEMSHSLFYLARRLRWDQYSHFTEGISYHFLKTYVLEEPEPQHLRFIEKRSIEVIPLALKYPDPLPTRIPAALIPQQKPLWIIVHTSNKTEVELLHQHAVDIAAIEKVKPFYVVLSDQEIDVPHGICINYFPAQDWFVIADRIFSAAGFNIIQQLKNCSNKHICIPFPRRYDDQAWRAKISVGNKVMDVM